MPSVPLGGQPTSTSDSHHRSTVLKSSPRILRTREVSCCFERAVYSWNKSAGYRCCCRPRWQPDAESTPGAPRYLGCRRGNHLIIKRGSPAWSAIPTRPGSWRRVLRPLRPIFLTRASSRLFGFHPKKSRGCCCFLLLVSPPCRSPIYADSVSTTACVSLSSVSHDHYRRRGGDMG